MRYEEFDGKVALVTGGAAGIGHSTALAFADCGADVVVSDVDDARGEQLAEQIREMGCDALFTHTDVSSPDQIEALFDQIDSTFGRLDYAFNNAGIEGEQAPTGECSLENWKKTIEVNLNGVFYCLKQEINRMVENGGGAIVNMSSVAGQKGFAGLPAYVAAKHGVVGLTRAAAVEYARTDVRINAVCPGVIDTEMIDRVTHHDPEIERQYVAMEPIGRMGEPHEIADAVLWLCSSDSSFVEGEALAIDGGLLAG